MSFYYRTSGVVVIIVLVGIIFANLVLRGSFQLKENAKLTTTELLSKFGYQEETHQITSSDGYILTLHRIPPPVTSKGVVFLLHGITCSSAHWVITGMENSLATLLSNAGYDVWMGNSRGNLYSRNHTTLNPDEDVNFWEFSWHEIGVIDLPEMIDYVLEKTNEKQLFHVGYSQGNTAFYVMTASKPQYNKKIKAHFSLAPTVYLDNMESYGIMLTSYVLDMVLGRSINEFLPKSYFHAIVGHTFCSDNSFTQIICEYFVFFNFGFSYNQLNSTLLPIIMGHTPAGTSTRQFTHFSQVINSGLFRQYDHGPEENLKKYNSSQPPIYDLSKITTDMYLLYSESDLVVHTLNIDRLCTELGNCKEKYAVPIDSFNHIDFIYGKNASQVVYDKVIRTLDLYT